MSITMEDPIGSYWAMKSSKDKVEEIVRLKQFEHQLAECFRLTGADPDGDEDWRLAPRAVEEVKRLREESDEESRTLDARVRLLEGFLENIRINTKTAGPDPAWTVSMVNLVATQALASKEPA